jgi:hypothetical protein
MMRSGVLSMLGLLINQVVRLALVLAVGVLCWPLLPLPVPLVRAGLRRIGSR